jgi:glyoxylase-like metal-dependent hydrolase (beta-lactamase superfamily II)
MLKRIGDIALIQLSDIDSNIYILGNSVIDAGTGFNFTRLRMILKAMKKDLSSFTQVINTHCHFDHVGGNGYFINAKFAIHETDAPVVEKGDKEMSMADFFDGNLHPKKPDVILKEGNVVDFGGLKLEVIHTPGHTPGSISLFSKEKGILFSGDTIFSDGVGRTDVPGGDPDALAASLEKLSKLNVKMIMPGHGEPVLSNGTKVIKDIIKSAAEAPEEEEE